MILKEAIKNLCNDYIGFNNNDWYHWKGGIDENKLPDGIELPHGNQYEKNVALKKALNNNWRNSTDEKEKYFLTKYYISTWGGIHTIKDKTVRNYAISIPIDLIANGKNGIASWSKALCVRDCESYAIFDARVSAALNSSQIINDTENKILYPILPSLNNKINDGNEVIRNIAINLNWQDADTNNFYNQYLNLLNEIAKELQISIYTIEMLLFAKAEDLVRNVINNNDIPTTKEGENVMRCNNPNCQKLIKDGLNKCNFCDQDIEEISPFEFNDVLRGNRIEDSKIIPTVSSLKLVLEKLNGASDIQNLKPWEKSCVKGYDLKSIINELSHPQNGDDKKSIIRKHILGSDFPPLGQNPLDIFVVAFFTNHISNNKDEFSDWVIKKVSKSIAKGSANAIWSVGKLDGEYLEILDNQGNIIDWGFMYYWVNNNKPCFEKDQNVLLGILDEIDEENNTIGKIQHRVGQGNINNGSFHFGKGDIRIGGINKQNQYLLTQLGDHGSYLYLKLEDDDEFIWIGKINNKPSLGGLLITRCTELYRRFEIDVDDFIELDLDTFQKGKHFNSVNFNVVQS